MNEQRKRKPGGGRKSNLAKGIEPTITSSVRLPKSVLEKAKELHGSLANALIFASKNKP